MTSLFGFPRGDLNLDIHTAGVLDSKEPFMLIRAASEIFMCDLHVFARLVSY